MRTEQALVKLQAMLAIALLAGICPLLLLVALVTKICGCLFSCCYTKQKTLAGEVALITGAAHGLGRALAIELAQRGCHIAVVDINLAGAEETVAQIKQLATVKAKAFKVNVSNYTELVELQANISQTLGTVTLLVNNAGLLLLSNSLNPAPQELQRMIDVNLTAHFWTKSIFLPAMKQLNKGYVLSISSLASIIPLPYNTSYTATKFAVTGYMKALRLELMLERQRNIKVCTVMPAFLQTNDEVTDLVARTQFDRLYPLISGEAAARRIIDGMIAGEKEIMLPGFGAVLQRILTLLPLSWQDYLLLFIANKYFMKFCELRA
ncbi:17-beta-hydroxysteroid dehydrogenase 13 [Drosophila busckii]|uniref:17-beta-hydroxysteroid dehydrogenase 13 n=1 Tax=Drosophila busckii TaxID=30019 RepID=UPI00083EC649|nr:17-beta-hydroxysteroid dehydrogenase 13 [Drosophila busckii]